MKKKHNYFKLFSICILSLPLGLVVSCNANFAKNIKYNTIDDQVLFESKQGQQLQQTIQELFANKFLETTILNDFANLENRHWDQTSKKWIEDQPSLLASAHSETEISQKMVEFNNFQGNLGADIYNQVEYEIWKNQAIDSQVRALLNDIRTIYNRTKQIYPIDVKIIKKDQLEWAQITFQVDLLSTLNKRFMGHYLQLVAEVPLGKLDDQKINANLFDFSNWQKSYQTSNYLLNILFNRFEQNNNFASYGLPENFLTSEQYLNNQLDNWSSLRFNLNSQKDHYILEYQQSKNPIINPNNGLVEGDYQRVIVKDQEQKIVEFSKDTLLSEVALTLEKAMFSQNENDFTKNIFNQTTGYEPHIEIVAKSGTSIEGITINDYLTNFVASTQSVEGLDFVNDYAHFNIYMTNHAHPSYSYLKLNNPLRAAITKEEIL